MLHLGNVPANSTLYIPFATYNGSGASVTLTGLAVTDIEIYKNGSVTQRASDAGYTLLDTDGIDFDAITGIHGFSIDLSDNTDAGFYAAGNFYWVVVSAITVDGQTVNFIAATFRIVAAESVTGVPKVDVADWLGSAPNSLVSGRVDSSVGAMANGVVTAAAVATDAIDGDALAASAVTEIQSGLATATAVADVQSDTNDIQTRLPAALVSGRMDSSVGAMQANTLTAAAVAADAVSELQAGLSTLTVAQIRDMVIEGTLTLEGVLRLILSATANKSHSPAAGQLAFRDVADSKNRIVANISGGIRTTVVHDPS